MIKSIYKENSDSDFINADGDYFPLSKSTDQLLFQNIENPVPSVIGVHQILMGQDVITIDNETILKNTRSKKIINVKQHI